MPCAATYDYHSLINNKGSLEDEALDQHFNKELSDFIERVTTSDNSKQRTATGNTSYRNLRRLRIRMIISLLCMAMNPTNTFLQRVVAYLYGLRDKGFDILNAFGIISSVDQVRKHGTFWSKKRCVTDELNRSVFWRVSFGNLNFKMKFAKCIGSALDGIKKMLNLITAQVSTRRTKTNNPIPQTQHVSTLQSLAKEAIRREFQEVTPIPHKKYL